MALATGIDHESIFREWVEQLINEHRNPSIKDDTEKEKHSHKLPNDEDEIKKRLDHLKALISTERVEIRNHRCIGDWIPEKQLVQIRKQVGSKITTIGFQNIQGKYLTPFEALLQLETNKLEVYEGHLPWTLSKAYSTCLIHHNNLEQYKAYRRQALESDDMKDEQSLEIVQKSKKICKKSSSNKSLEMCEKDNFSTLHYNNIFKDMKEKGPKYDAINKMADGNTSNEANSSILRDESFIKNLLEEGKSHAFCIGGSIIDFEPVETTDVPPYDT